MPAACVAGGVVQLRAQQRVHRLRLLRRRGLAGADGPDGLVGDDDLADAVAVDVDHGGQLALDDFFGLPGFALCQRFADADDGRDAVRQRGGGLGGHQLVGLAVVLAALRMADDGVAHAEVLQHGRRLLAGEGALRAAPTHPARPARSASRPTSACTCARYGAGTHTAIVARRRADTPASSAFTSASLAARLPFIFQLPAISFSSSSCLAHQVSTILPMCWFDSIRACAWARRWVAARRRCCGSPA